MTLHPMKLVTIVCEALAREPLLRLLAEVGTHGYTLATVEGSGSHGARPADLEEFANIELQVVLPTDKAQALLERLEAEFFARYAMIAYESDVRVLRGGKF